VALQTRPTGRVPMIQSATNKSERFNQFVQWVAFGGGALAAEGIRDEQRKFINYNHLVVNLLSFHNVVTMSKALEQLATEGHALDAELSRLPVHTRPNISIASGATLSLETGFQNTSTAFESSECQLTVKG
jgi:hypothetical protein